MSASPLREHCSGVPVLAVVAGGGGGSGVVVVVGGDGASGPALGPSSPPRRGIIPQSGTC